MGQLAVIELICPLCNKTTRASLPDMGKERGDAPRIKCRRCGKTFKFTPGFLYKPVGYADKEPPEEFDPLTCMICGTKLKFPIGAEMFFPWAIDEASVDALAYHCRECNTSICYKCAHSDKCVVCGGIHFDKSTEEPSPKGPIKAKAI